jgi:hypothetical protein
MASATCNGSSTVHAVGAVRDTLLSNAVMEHQLGASFIPICHSPLDFDACVIVVLEYFASGKPYWLKAFLPRHPFRKFFLAVNKHA